MDNKMRNKAQLGGLQGIIMTLVVVGILIGVAFLVLTEFKDATNTSPTTSAEVVNETVTTVTGTGEWMTNNHTVSTIPCYGDFTPITVTNKTSGQILTASNYSYTSTGKIYSIASGAYNNTDWNVTYTYTYGGDACEGIEDTIAAASKITTFLPIIVIVAIVGILLTIVFLVLPRTAKNETAYI
jgi:hypothetical protein